MSQMMNANNMMNEEYKQAMTQQQQMMMMHQQEWQKAEEENKLREWQMQQEFEQISLMKNAEDWEN